jgi:hypothetical protein
LNTTFFSNFSTLAAVSSDWNLSIHFFIIEQSLFSATAV